MNHINKIDKTNYITTLNENAKLSNIFIINGLGSLTKDFKYNRKWEKVGQNNISTHTGYRLSTYKYTNYNNNSENFYIKTTVRTLSNLLKMFNGVSVDTIINNHVYFPQFKQACIRDINVEFVIDNKSFRTDNKSFRIDNSYPTNSTKGIELKNLSNKRLTKTNI